MENVIPVQTEDILAALLRHATENRADLASRYNKVLRKTLFTNRSKLHPGLLGRIAAEEADALFNFLGDAQYSGKERGIQLCKEGLSEQTLLGLGQATRQFFLTYLESDWIVPALNVIDVYQSAVMQGYMYSREEIILAEQERIRGALTTAVGHYTVEIREVQNIAQKASEANEFKIQFIARISHELRTPLGAMMGMAEMLQENIYGELTDGQRDVVQRIIKNAQTLKQVFSELLDQSQIESGKLRLKQEEFSPRVLAETIRVNYLSIAVEKGLTLQLEIENGTPDTIIGDRTRTEQILSNLVVNAIKYTERGSVSIRVSKEDEAHWGLSVTDTGIGISEEDMLTVFEPYRQINEHEGKKHGGGVGLGLSIVKQLVAAMRGSITMKSKLGWGSVFVVTLPIKAEQ